MQDEIALGRSATALARTLLDRRPATIRQVGRSFNRTIARVTLAGPDVGSERVATGGRAPAGARTLMRTRE
jgi:hypothetical protein